MDGLCGNCREDLRVRKGPIEGAFRPVVTLKKLKAEIDMVVECRGQVRTDSLGFLWDDQLAHRSAMDPNTRFRPAVDSGSHVAGERRRGRRGAR